LIIVLVLMAGATTVIGLLPTRESIGIAAPILLTLVRILQGLSAGGEFGGAVSIMTEFAPPGKRGLYGSLQSFTVALGLLAGAGLAALLSAALSEQALNDYGWRIPFLLALPLGAVALWLRLRLEETPAFVAAQGKDAGGAPGTSAPAAAPVARPGFARTLRVILIGIGRMMGWSAAGYTFLVVLPSYLQTSLNATFLAALAATVIANLGFASAIIPAGALSDRVGRKAVMVTGAGLTALLALPLINVLQDPDTTNLARGAAVFLAGAVVGLMAGPGPAMLSEMFPTTVRYTGLGLSYSLSNAVFSGSAGLIITALIARTDNIDIPAYYVIGTCLVSVLALLTLRGDDHRRALRA
jgi:MFS family permease